MVIQRSPKNVLKTGLKRRKNLLCLQKSRRTVRQSRKMCKLPASQEEGEDVVALEDKEEEVRLEGEVPLRLKCVLHAAIIAIKYDSATARQRDRDSVTGIGSLV